MKGNSKLLEARILLGHVEVKRLKYLSGFLGQGQRQLGWTIGILSSRPYPFFCEDIEIRKNSFFSLPNPSRMGEWELDEAQMQRARELMSDCELRTGLPLHRIVLADARHSGRGYGCEFYNAPLGILAARALRDNALPEKLMLRLLIFVDDVLEAFHPDFIVSVHHASPPSFLLALLASIRGISVFTVRPSKILSHRCFWTQDLMMLNTRGAELCASKVAASTTPCKESVALLKRFRERPTTVAYISQNWEIFAAEKRAALKEVFYRCLDWVRWSLSGRRELQPKSVAWKATKVFSRSWLKARQARLFKSFAEEELTRFRYVLLALHKEPELAINFQAPFWHNQKNLIAWVSKNLPSGYRLLVRDHRKNEGRRPMSFFRDIMGYAGVDLVSPFDSQFKYIRHADLIVSDTGSTGWEGLVAGKRVISLARNFYEPTALAEKVSDPSRLGEVILRRLSDPEVLDQAEWERRLACLVEAEMETTLVEDESSYDQSLELISSLLSSSEAPARRLRLQTSSGGRLDVA